MTAFCTHLYITLQYHYHTRTFLDTALVANNASMTHTTAGETHLHSAGLNDCVRSVSQEREVVFLSLMMGRRWFANPQRFGWYVLIRIARAVFTPIFYLAAVIVVKKGVIGKFKPGPRDMSQWGLLRHWLMAKLLPGSDLGKVFQLHGSEILTRMLLIFPALFTASVDNLLERGSQKKVHLLTLPPSAQIYLVVASTI